MDDANYYFIYHIDVYRGKNTASIDIQPSLQKITTTHKSVANYIIKSVISNDTHGYRHIYMDNIYASIQIFALMDRNYNLREVGTCRSNRKGFDSEQ